MWWQWNHWEGGQTGGRAGVCGQPDESECRWVTDAEGCVWTAAPLSHDESAARRCLKKRHGRYLKNWILGMIFLWWYIDKNGFQNFNTNSIVVLPRIEPVTSCAVLGVSAMPKYLFNFARSKFLYYVIYWRVNHKTRGLKSLKKYVKTNYLFS